MSTLLTLQYVPDGKSMECVNNVPDAQAVQFVDQLVETVTTGVGHKIVAVAQMLVIDEVRLRIARGELEVPVVVQYWDKDMERHEAPINKYGVIQDPGFPDPALERSSNILWASISRRRAERAKEQ